MDESYQDEVACEEVRRLAEGEETPSACETIEQALGSPASATPCVATTLEAAPIACCDECVA